MSLCLFHRGGELKFLPQNIKTLKTITPLQQTEDQWLTLDQLQNWGGCHGNTRPEPLLKPIVQLAAMPDSEPPQWG